MSAHQASLFVVQHSLLMVRRQLDADSEDWGDVDDELVMAAQHMETAYRMLSVPAGSEAAPQEPQAVSNGFLDTSENFHPYECDGRGECVHCDRRITSYHHPADCALCDPEYDMQPNEHVAASLAAPATPKEDT